MSRTLLFVGLFLVVSTAAGQERQPRFLKEIRLPVGRCSEVVFSPDGTQMAVGVGSNIVVCRVADATEVVRMQLPRTEYWHSLVFAADGKTLVWKAGMASWAAAESVPELQPMFSDVPPPLPM